MADDVVRTEVARYPVRPGVRLSEVINRVSWGAVWAGVMIALGMEALFTLFGFFIGFGMYNYTAPNPWSGISAWSTIWYLVTAGWSMFFGAWCAARLSGNPVREAGILHGITTWGLATFATILVVALGSWAVLREGINVLSAAIITGAQPLTGAAAATAPNAGPMGQATANVVSAVSLRIFGGILLGFITAILGGLAGRTSAVVLETRETIPAGPRMAA